MSKHLSNIAPVFVDEDKIVEEDISTIMKNNFTDYAVNIILERALADVRDGLKPVHRRVLYAMYGLNLSPDNKRVKSAKIVGETMGRFHPHGDSSIYETLVRMGQDFTLRYPLVDPKGNFGSIDGDTAAAMRYTEAKLSPIAMELFRDIKKNTIDFIPNYDNTEKEPKVLPARFPNLLVNGVSGIAVGMATNIPPHNLNEIIHCIIAMLTKKRVTDDELLEMIPGPDFPTGGIIVGKEGIREAYLTGKGQITLRGRLHVEEPVTNKPPQIVITEIPYGIKKPSLIEKIATLIRDNTIEEISDIRDESNRNGMRIVIELKKDANIPKIIKLLYSKTSLSTTYGIINLVLIDKTPQVVPIRTLLEQYIDFQRDIIIRRSKFELEKTKREAKILEGLVIVVNDIDSAVQLIKASKNSKDAKEKLMKQYKLSDEQAQAVLELRLQRLTSLEITALEKELKNKQKEIKRLENILKNTKNVDQVLIQELRDIVNTYGDERKTEIVEKEEDIHYEHITGKETVIMLSNKGYIASCEPTQFSQSLNKSTNKISLVLQENDYIQHYMYCKTDQTFAIFSNDGKIYKLDIKDIPNYGVEPQGIHVSKLLGTSEDDSSYYPVVITNEENESLLFVTKNGFVKRMEIKELPRSKSSVIKLNNGDELVAVLVDSLQSDLIITTKNGKCLRFSTSDLKPLGRTAAGVIGMKLDKNDKVISANLCDNSTHVLSITENGYCKMTTLKEYKKQSRGGKGVSVSQVDSKKDPISNVLLVHEGDLFSFSTSKGRNFYCSFGEIPQSGRATIGEKIVPLEEHEKIVHACIVKYGQM